MTTLKTLTIVAAVLASGSSLALAQNGPPRGGQPPVAGGANGGGWYPGYGYGYGYVVAPLYNYAAPAYGYAAPVYVVPAPVYMSPPVGSREWNIEKGW